MRILVLLVVALILPASAHATLDFPGASRMQLVVTAANEVAMLSDTSAGATLTTVANGKPRLLPAVGGTRIGTYGRNRVVVAGVDTRVRRVRVSWGDASTGALESVLLPGHDDAVLGIAVNHSGDLVLMTAHGNEPATLWSRARSTKAFTRSLRVLRLDRAAWSTVALAVGRQGDALLVWGDRGFVRDRVRRNDGHWKPAQLMEGVVGPMSSLRVAAAIDHANTAYMAWAEAGDTKDAGAVGLAAGPVRKTFEGYQTVDGVFSQRGRPATAIALASEGTRTVMAWNAVADERPVVRASAVGRYGWAGDDATQTLSPPAARALLDAAAVAPDGRVLVTWRSADGLFASLRPAARGRFAVAQRLAVGVGDGAGATVFNRADADFLVAFPAADGHGTVVASTGK